MNSECSSGCESGWTLYLEQSSKSRKVNVGFSDGEKGSGKRVIKGKQSVDYHYEDEDKDEEDEEEEEDLSMVSDASSGPPHFNNGDEVYSMMNDGCYYGYQYTASTPPALPKTKTIGKKQRKKHEDQQQIGSSFLDDTASSPLINFSNNNNNLTKPSMESAMDYSQGFSATHYQGRTFQNHFNFFQPENQIQNNQWY